ncbi:hypothetical protein [Pectobacterium carotovorum]|uniref:hypothetical protein n=1 Tax=Pectobacterium carotovorum TaxID=554 RepID=UPI00058053F2|nr:hypothetical protein [Pectobacterium carotovorum]KHT34410.1 hypothetical protein RD01_05835 [Pectobacterium carotovorum subsp. carotovorum]
MIFIRTAEGSKKIDNWEEITSRACFSKQIIKSEHKLSEIIGYYRFKEKIHCGLKGCNQPHQMGYLVRTEIGVETNIGNICGGEEFGVKFTELTEQFDKFMRLETNKSIVYEAKEKCNIWQASIDVLRNTKPSIDACAINIEKIQNANFAGRLAATEIRLLAKSQDGIVTLNEIETEKWARSILFATNRHMRESGEATTEYIMGTVSFTNVLLPENNLRERFVSISEDIKSIRQLDLDNASSPAILSIAQVANTIDERIRQLKNLFHDARKFLTKKNLSAISSKLKYSSTTPENELAHFESFSRSLGR